VEIDGKMHWSQPEIVLYDPDPAVRISYPDLIEEEGRVLDHRDAEEHRAGA
jgi:hypothetical protein